MIRRNRMIVAALAAALLSTASAFATITTYTDQTAWAAAVGPYVTEPFDSGGLQSFTSVSTTNGAIGPARGVLTGSVWTDLVLPGTVSTTFGYVPGNLYGVGALWDTSPNSDGCGLLFIDNIFGGTETVGEISAIHGGFFGWTSTTPFQSFGIAGGSLPGVETFDMDNLSFAPIPEPAGLSLVVLCSLGILRRRRR